MRALAASLALLVVVTADVQAAGFGRRDRDRGSERESEDEASRSSGSGRFGRRSGSSASTPAPSRESTRFDSSVSRGFGRSSELRESRRDRRFRGDRRVRRLRRERWIYGYAAPFDGYYSQRWGVYPWGYYAYGYHPVWGAPPAPPEAPAPSTLVGAAFLGGYLTRRGADVTGELRLEDRRWGLNARGSTLGNPAGGGIVDTMPLFAMHATWSVVSEPWARLRLEAGFSGIVAPDLHYFGPDVGVSAQVALLGPFGFDASARVTPFPATIVDLEAGATLQLGALALRGGLRRVWLDDTGVNDEGGSLGFFGPAVSLGVVF